MAIPWLAGPAPAREDVSSVPHSSVEAQASHTHAAVMTFTFGSRIVMGVDSLYRVRIYHNRTRL
jgi:hypothetical protein